MLIVRGRWRRRLIGIGGLLAFWSAGVMTALFSNRNSESGLRVSPIDPTSDSQIIDGLLTRRYDLRGFFFNAGPGCFPDPSRDRNISRNMGVDVNELGAATVKLIVDTIESDSWEGLGGKATARWENGYLIVRQTAENHKQLDHLFEQLLETHPFNSVRWIGPHLSAK